MIDVIGLGDGGWAALGRCEQEVVRAARVLLGGRRHLDLVPAVDGQQRRVWPVPMLPALDALLAEVGATVDGETGVVVLASGDPLLSGIGTTLVARLGAARVRIAPALSSETLARARMGWAAEETTTVSLVGRSLDRLRRHLAPRARLVVLCSDGRTPAAIAALLRDEGYAAARLTALWHLGGPEEGRRAAAAGVWADAREIDRRDSGSQEIDSPDSDTADSTATETSTPDLVTVAVELPATAPTRRPGADGPAPGRPESAFDHDGQITKRDVRASALAHLRPTPGATLWDLGAGSGAVSIEWALAAPRARAVAVEQDATRAERARHNASRLGVAAEVTVVGGVGIDVVRGGELPTPDAVFVGGGLSEPLLEAVWPQLPAGGRLVAHAVTLGAEATLAAAHAAYGGELTRISVERAQPLGRHLSWTPARAVVQWSVTKEAVG